MALYLLADLRLKEADLLLDGVIRLLLLLLNTISIFGRR